MKGPDPGLKAGRSNDDAHGMTEVSTWANPVAVVARELTYAEVADLDRLRAVLASAVDRTDARAVSWLWDSMVAAHGGRPAPAGFVEAVATALGDLLAVHVPGVHWSVWPGPAGPTLGVASEARPHAPVVPFLDAQDRWSSREQDWILDYLSRAAAHLTASAVPQPRVAPDDTLADGATALGARASYPVVVAGGAGDADGSDRTAPVAERLGHTNDEPAKPPAETASGGPILAEAPAAAAEPAPEPEPQGFPAPTGAIPAPAFAAPAAISAPAFVAPAAASPVPATSAEAAPAVATSVHDMPLVPDMPLEDFALDALDHAMALLRETGAFDREVFVLLLDGAGRRTESCPGDPGEARFRARELVRSSSAARAAITWIERDPVDLPGPRQLFPAVVVDAWDAGTEGVRVGRRFVDDVLGTGPLGGRLVVGRIAPLL